MSPHATHTPALGTSHAVLDLFAGTGVGAAIRQLRVPEHGVEIMPEACETRAANGMVTVYNDVWDAHLADGLTFDTLWGSPPCQQYSTAGNGAGRRALNDVLSVIDDRRFEYMVELRAAAAELGDDKIGLVLAPLHYAHKFRPTFIALEQVPPVLPIWEAYATVLRGYGYSVWTGILSSEQFGVAQVRKRAILMARRDGTEVTPPAPTHSKYYSAKPERLDEGVEKWVTMADALNWTPDTHPDVPAWVFNRPSPTVVGLRRSSTGMLVGRQLTDGSRMDVGGKQTNTGIQTGQLPAVRITHAEAAAIQSYPDGFHWRGSRLSINLQIGNAVPPKLAEAVLRQLWAK